MAIAAAVGCWRGKGCHGPERALFVEVGGCPLPDYGHHLQSNFRFSCLVRRH